MRLGGAAWRRDSALAESFLHFLPSSALMSVILPLCFTAGMPGSLADARHFSAFFFFFFEESFLPCHSCPSHTSSSSLSDTDFFHVFFIISFFFLSSDFTHPVICYIVARNTECSRIVWGNMQHKNKMQMTMFR